MRKTAFVCFGSDGEKASLVYHELPRKESGEEFFVFMSPDRPGQAEILRPLFRTAISASRLGHPIHFFSNFIDHMKESIQQIETEEDPLRGSLVVIMIRRGSEIYLFHPRRSVSLHWDGVAGTEGPIGKLPGMRELCLVKPEDQGDLFKHGAGEDFTLEYFVAPEGEHTIVFTPSKEFTERYREELRNSVLFPSFEVPAERGVEIAVSRSFPALHWSTADRAGIEENPAGRKLRFRRIPIPVVVGAATALAALLIVFGPLRKSRQEGVPEQSVPLLSAQDESIVQQEVPADAPVTERSAPRTPESVEGGELVEVDRIQLREAWKTKFTAPVTSSPVYFDGSVYFGCRDGHLYAYTPDGTLKWEYASGAGIGASPACGDGRVIGADYAGAVFCLDAHTGEKLWAFSAREKIVSSPRLHGDLVIIGTMEGKLIALALADGSRRWAQKVGNGIWSTSSIGGDYIITTTTDGSLIKLDHSGSISWRVKPGGGILSSPLCIEEKNLVVFGTKDRYVYAYSLSRGDLMWRFVTQGEVNGAPVADEDRIYIGSEDGNIYALSLTGQPLWKRHLGGAILSRPLLSDRAVFVTSYGSKVTAIEREGGKVISEFKTASPVYSSPARGVRRLYFGSNGGTFYALRLYAGDA